MDRSRREVDAALNGQLFLPRRASHSFAGPLQVVERIINGPLPFCVKRLFACCMYQAHIS